MVKKNFQNIGCSIFYYTYIMFYIQIHMKTKTEYNFNDLCDNNTF